MSDDDLSQDDRRQPRVCSVLACSRGKVMDNQPFDEAFDVNDPEEIASNLAASPLPAKRVSKRANLVQVLRLFRRSKFIKFVFCFRLFILLEQVKQMDRGNTPPNTPSDMENSEYDDMQEAAVAKVNFRGVCIYNLEASTSCSQISFCTFNSSSTETPNHRNS